jgi:cysteine synthase A
VRAFVNATERLVGHTPLLEVSGFFDAKNPLHLKLSYLNPSGSIKDRPVLAMLRALRDRGELEGKAGIVEVTSGNTGIALSYWARHFGLEPVVVMPCGMSAERCKMMNLLGAEVLHHGDTFDEAKEEARRLAEERDMVYLGQFSRPENPASYRDLAREFAAAGAECVVAGVGTGGTLMGLARVLKHRGVHTVAVFPEEENHGIQGIGDGICGSFCDDGLVDEEFRVTTVDARRAMHLLWDKGFLAGRSSGANLAAALHFARERSVATVLPDSWDRYFSIEDRNKSPQGDK